MSASTAKLEARIEALEAEVAELKRQQAQSANGVPWWRQIAGTIPNDEITRRAEAYGRQYRESLK